MVVKAFTFNPFQENTYVIFDQTKEAIIIDPGCYDQQEESQLINFIKGENLRPKAIVNTHCHIDHVFGIEVIRKEFEIDFYCHKDEIPILEAVPAYAPVYGLRFDPIETIKTIDQNERLIFGNCDLEIRLTPGHSPASICFIDHESKQVIAGDVLFNGSIGRFDLPGGDYQTLMSSIESQLLSLDDDYIVYPGHGEKTTIGHERRTNPFIKEWVS